MTLDLTLVPNAVRRLETYPSMLQRYSARFAALRPAVGRGVRLLPVATRQARGPFRPLPPAFDLFHFANTDFATPFRMCDNCRDARNERATIMCDALIEMQNSGVFTADQISLAAQEIMTVLSEDACRHNIYYTSASSGDNSPAFA